MKKLSVFCVLFLTALLALGSCDTEKLNGDTPTPQPQPEEEDTFSVYLDIKLVLGDAVMTKSALTWRPVGIDADFKSTDRLYLYNETRDAFACDEMGERIRLYPKYVIPDGDSCTLAGGLTFRHNVNGVMEKVAPGPDDTYSIFFGINTVDVYRTDECCFSYINQNETLQSAENFYCAESRGVKFQLKDRRLTREEPVVLNPLQSVLCQRVTYLNADGEKVVPVKFKGGIINSTHRTLASRYYPTRDKNRYTRGQISFNMNDKSNPDTLLFVLPFAYDEGHTALDDKIKVTVTVEQKVDGKNTYVNYEGVMDAPEDGFYNGRLYMGDITLQETALSIECLYNDYYWNEDYNPAKPFDLVANDYSIKHGGSADLVLYPGSRLYMDGLVHIKGSITQPSAETFIRNWNHEDPEMMVKEKTIITGNSPLHNDCNTTMNITGDRGAQLEVNGDVNGSYGVGGRLEMIINGDEYGKMTVHDEGKLIVNGEVHSEIILDGHGVAIINDDVYAPLTVDGRSYAVVNGVINGKTHFIDDGCCLEIHSRDLPAAHFILDGDAELKIYTERTDNSDLVKVTSYDQEMDLKMGFGNTYSDEWPKIIREQCWFEDEEVFCVRYKLEYVADWRW